MNRPTSFSLSPEDENFINEQVASGRYRSSSEVMRQAIRRMREEEAKEAALFAALDEGDASPDAPDGVWERLEAKHQRKAVAG